VAINITKAGLRDLVGTLSTPWLRLGTQPGDGYQGGLGRLMYSFGLLNDGLLEKMDQGMRAHMPGYGNQQTLSLNAVDRVLVQGAGETSALFTVRLKTLLDAWRYAGNHASVLHELRAAMSPYLPAVYLVSNTPTWDWFDSNVPDTTSTLANGLPGPANASAPGTWLPPVHWAPAGDNWTWGTETGWWLVWLVIQSGLSVAGTVTAATNATPIAITTSAAHNLSTGNQVCVDGVAGNLNANGYWVVTVTGSTTFTLNGSVGSAAYTSGGTVYLVPSTAVQYNGNILGPAPFVTGQTSAPAMGADPNVCCGFNVAPTFFTSLRQILGTWKSQNEWIRWMVVSFDPTTFNPWNTSSTPAASWETWATRVSGVLVSSRLGTARYVDGVY
jgi:hypothetical protein